MADNVINRWFWLFIAIISIGFYVVVSHTPLYEDDYYFVFFNSPEEIRDSSLGWSFIPGYIENFSGVARFIPHLFVAFFGLVVGKAVFNIVAAISFVLLCFLISRIATNDRTRILPLMLCVAAVLWFIIPGFFQACLWMSGACNYLFVALLILSFYLLLVSPKLANVKLWVLPLLFIFGFVVGWTNEGFVVGLAVGLFIYYIQHLKELTSGRIAMLVGFYIGAINLCFSPYNIHRFFLSNGNGSVVSIGKSIVQSAMALTDINVTFILLGIILVCCMVSTRSRKMVISFCKKYLIFVIALVISILFLIMTHHTSANSRFPNEFYSTVLLICLTNEMNINKTRIIALICSIFLIIGIGIVIPKSIKNYRSYEVLKSQVIRNESVIVADNVDTDWYTGRYIYPIHYIYQSWVMNSADRFKSYYGGKSDSSILSTEMYGLMQKYNAPGTRIYKPSWGMSCVRVSDKGEIDNVIYTLKPVDISSMPFWKRLIAPLFGRYTLNEVPAHRYHILYINNERWLIVLDHPMVNDRVNSMRICIKD